MWSLQYREFDCRTVERRGEETTSFVRSLTHWFWIDGPTALVVGHTSVLVYRTSGAFRRDG